MTDPDFDRFWNVYPKRTPHANPRQPAFKAFLRALKRGALVEDLIDGARGYAEYCRRQRIKPQFICMASTWLNQERYEDFLSTTEKATSDMAREILLGKR